MERIKLAIDKARQAAQQAQPRPVHRLDGTVPAAGLKPSRTQALDPKHLATHRIVAFQRLGPSRLPFDLLRTQVLQKMQANGWTTLAVTSPSMHSGKTMVAIKKARSNQFCPSQSAAGSKMTKATASCLKAGSYQPERKPESEYPRACQRRAKPLRCF